MKKMKYVVHKILAAKLGGSHVDRKNINLF
jgi:hypothetical protein